jgi:hypothetical protein
LPEVFGLHLMEKKQMPMPMRWLKRVVPVALALGAVFIMPMAAGAQAVCSGTQSTDVIANLLVPKGVTCTLEGITVTGSITVQPGGCLIVGQASAPARVGGNINATDAACLSIGFGSAIGGNVIALGTTGNPSGYSFNFMCNSLIGGSVEINNSEKGADWCIGGKAACACAAGENIIGGLTFDANKGATNNISDNTIGSNMNCAGNTGLTGSGNTASRKLGQCSTF